MARDKVIDRPGGHVIDVNREIFRGTVVDNLMVEVFSVETERIEHTCYYKRTFEGKPESWIGSYRSATSRR